VFLYSLSSTPKPHRREVATAEGPEQTRSVKWKFFPESLFFSTAPINARVKRRFLPSPTPQKRPEITFSEEPNIFWVRIVSGAPCPTEKYSASFCLKDVSEHPVLDIVVHNADKLIFFLSD
jgi:hypothetical protein